MGTEGVMIFRIGDAPVFLKMFWKLQEHRTIILRKR